MKKLTILVIFSFLAVYTSVYAADQCVSCHEKVGPGQVADWRVSKHFDNDISCADCHGTDHTNATDSREVSFPDEEVCAECHEEQFEQFSKGKHNLGWTAMNAMPVTHVEPDELMEGGRGCGGCHNMGIKSDAQKKTSRTLVISRSARCNLPMRSDLLANSSGSIGPECR